MKRIPVSILAAGLLALSACSRSAPPDPNIPPEAMADLKAVEATVPVVAEGRTAAPGGLKPLGLEVARQLVNTEPVELAKPVADALRPKVAPLVDAKVKAPRVRSSDVERGDLPSAKPSATAVPLPPIKRKATVPSPPNEAISSRVGEGSEMNWRDSKFPESPAVKSPPRPEPTAADVPRLGYPVSDRIPVDDPTAEISTLRIVNTLILAPTIAAPFVRLMLPDPFEFAEHVKATPTSEFATLPVLVPMARP